ncbi:hydroxyacid dehydrogenase [Plantibacter auratus]|uniref:hydroxyacid dehydrogenase n=1 Tax=Plantibacter auratus TaxID=272914 RepID=UPI003D329BB0
MPQSESAPTGTIGFLMPDGTFDRVFSEPDLARLRSESHARLPWDRPLRLERAADRARLAAVEVLVTGWGSPVLDETLLRSLPSLRAVAHSAGSVRGIVTDALLERRIALTSSATANAVPVAEFTMAMVILAAKRTFWAAETLRASRAPVDAERAWPTVGSHGITVGVVGASRIGRLVVERLASLDVRVVVADPTLDHEEQAALGVPCVTLDELAAHSDIVTLHAPALPSTRHLVDRSLLQLMRPGTTVINTARGDLIDHDALADRLDRGDLVAILDVTSPEILPPSSRLWSTPNTVITPHIAGSAGNELARLAANTVDEALHFVRFGTFHRPITLAALALQA